MSPRDRRSFARREVRSRARTFARDNWWQLSAIVGIYVVSVLIGRLLGGSGYWQGVVEGGLLVTMVAWVGLHFMLHTGSLDPIAGAQGEGRTAEALAKAQKLGYLWGAVHNVELDRGDIDSVVVTPAGVLAIETKWMTRELDRRWLDQHLQQAMKSARKTRSILRSADVVKEVHDVKPVVVVWGAARADIAAGGEAHDEVYVIDGDELVDWLQRFRTGPIANDNAERVLEALERFAAKHGRR